MKAALLIFNRQLNHPFEFSEERFGNFLDWLTQGSSKPFQNLASALVSAKFSPSFCRFFG